MTNLFSIAVTAFSSFVIPLACVSRVKVSEAENGEIDERDDSQAKQEQVSLQISYLNQTQERADSQRTTAGPAYRPRIDDPSINERADAREKFLRPID